MKPIAYDEIAKNAEERRAAIEAFVPMLQQIPARWDKLQADMAELSKIRHAFKKLDQEAQCIVSGSVGIGLEPLKAAIDNLLPHVPSTCAALNTLINAMESEDEEPAPVHRFIPVHKMPAGSLVMTEAKTARQYAIDDAYNGRGKHERQVGVLHVQIDPDTLELVGASLEKL